MTDGFQSDPIPLNAAQMNVAEDIAKSITTDNLREWLAIDMVRDFCEKHGEDPEPHIAWMRSVVGTCQPTWHGTLIEVTWDNAAYSVIFNLLSDYSILYGNDSEYWPGGPKHDQDPPPSYTPLGIPANPNAILEDKHDGD